MSGTSVLGRLWLTEPCPKLTLRILLAEGNSRRMLLCASLLGDEVATLLEPLDSMEDGTP